MDDKNNHFHTKKLNLDYENIYSMDNKVLFKFNYFRQINLNKTYI